MLELCPPRTISEIRGCLRRGPKTQEMKEVYSELAVAVFALRRQQRATPPALRAALECSERTYLKLQQAGASAVDGHAA